MPALKSFAVLSFNNEDTCKAIASGKKIAFNFKEECYKEKNRITVLILYNFGIKHFI